MKSFVDLTVGGGTSATSATSATSGNGVVGISIGAFASGITQRQNNGCGGGGTVTTIKNQECLGILLALLDVLLYPLQNPSGSLPPGVIRRGIGTLVDVGKKTRVFRVVGMEGFKEKVSGMALDALVTNKLPSLRDEYHRLLFEVWEGGRGRFFGEFLPRLVGGIQGMGEEEKRCLLGSWGEDGSREEGGFRRGGDGFLEMYRFFREMKET